MDQKKELGLENALNEIKAKIALLELLPVIPNMDIENLKISVDKKLIETKGEFAKVRKSLKKRKAKLKKRNDSYKEEISLENALARVKAAEKYAVQTIKMLVIAHDKVQISMAELALANSELQKQQVES